MIRIEIYENAKGSVCGFKAEGHAGLAERGQDILCSAASVLMLNSINSVESFTEAEFTLDTDEAKGGYLEFLLPGVISGGEERDAELILKVMEKGLSDLEMQYGEFLKVSKREVRK